MGSKQRHLNDAWLEENVKAYTKDFGEWISWSYQKDEMNDLFDPVICLSTNKMDKIKEDMIILGKGVQYSIKFEEIFDLKELLGKVYPMQISPCISYVSNSQVHHSDNGFSKNPNLKVGSQIDARKNSQAISHANLEIDGEEKKIPSNDEHSFVLHVDNETILNESLIEKNGGFQNIDSEGQHIMNKSY